MDSSRSTLREPLAWEDRLLGIGWKEGRAATLAGKLGRLRWGHSSLRLQLGEARRGPSGMKTPQHLFSPLKNALLKTPQGSEGVGPSAGQAPGGRQEMKEAGAPPLTLDPHSPLACLDFRHWPPEL